MSAPAAVADVQVGALAEDAAQVTLSESAPAQPKPATATTNESKEKAEAEADEADDSADEEEGATGADGAAGADKKKKKKKKVRGCARARERDSCAGSANGVRESASRRTWTHR